MAPQKPPRKPVSEMSGSEVGAILDGLTRLQLESMLIYLAGHAPAAFETALDHFGAEGSGH